VLRQVRDEDADDDEAVRRLAGYSRQREAGGSLHRDGEVGHVGMGQLPAPRMVYRLHQGVHG
jgi:hypothetical protein